MTSAQVVETSVKVTTNSPSQDYTHPDDHVLIRTYDMTPEFKPFTIIMIIVNGSWDLAREMRESGESFKKTDTVEPRPPSVREVWSYYLGGRINKVVKLRK